MASQEINQSSTWQCFSPTAGIFAGILFGWFFHFLLPEPANFAVDLAARTLDLVIALTGWAIGTAFYRRQIQCGGSQAAEKETLQRYGAMAKWLWIPLVLAPSLLVKGYVVLYYIDSLFLLAVLCGEIKLGRPFWFIDGKEIR